MLTFLVFAALVLIILVIVQVAKTNEYISILHGEERSEDENNKIQSRIFLIFGIVGFIACFWSVYHFKDMFLPEAATVHGKYIDQMFNITLFFTGIMFVATNVALFWFAFKYRFKRGQFAYYYPENNKLEMIWTIIPAIVLTTLVIYGLYRWFQITSPPPTDAAVVEITGKQFAWMVRYPGADGKLGERKFDYIDDANSNSLGIDWTDPASHDDILPTEIHLVVNKPVLFRIGARDVIHDVGIAFFRVKMDAVPGIPTHFWFTPTTTTQEMRTKLGRPEFNYEVACDQLCGNGHYGMRYVIVVESQEDYDKWMASQTSYYNTVIKDTEYGKTFAQVKADIDNKKKGSSEAEHKPE